MIEYLRKKISLEESTDRTLNSPTWGVMTATTFYIKVSFTQHIKDLGLFEDSEYIPYDQVAPDYSILTTKLNLSGFTFPFMTGAVAYPTTGLTPTELLTLRFTNSGVTDYYHYGNLPITGVTDSKLDELKSYNQNTPYIPNLDITTQVYNDYENVTVSGVSRVISVGDPMVYVFDAPVDANIGTNNQVFGLQYKDYSANTSNQVINGVYTSIPLANFRYIGEGFNETNVSLSAITKEEYLFGIISPPEVQSDVFIDRGTTSVMDYHLKLSEIKSLGELINYGNGFYNLTTI